ncbi:MAG: Hsp33 family molecular chaperone HslO, partial [Planctomycetaceae bacterium]|nr:Hsp33 family molecular chaperone HslO [Planctomycetaceae bacterium]
MQQDFNQRFLIEEYGIRGQIVRLNQTWTRLLSCDHYPERLQQILAQASVASNLLASILKYEGKLTLQISGKG